jgi:hypothetical protein
MPEISVSFPDAEDAAAANAMVGDLQRALADQVPDADVHPVRTDEAAQDFGAAAEIVLHSAAVVAVAKGLGDWIRGKGTKVALKAKRSDGSTFEFEVDGRSGQAPELLAEGLKALS